MSKTFRKDLTGQRFGRLTVIEFVPNEKSHSYWKCKCDCGNECVVSTDNLKNANVTSCGCYHKEMFCNLKHGKRKSRLYKTWQNMKTRCYNQRNKNYKYYGERGIMLCDEWKDDFKAFHDWAMQNGYNDTLTIDRIDVNGDYEPSNCRWVTMKEQGRNKRNNVIVEYQGKRMLLKEASKKSGISINTLIYRWHRGDRGKNLFRLSQKK